MNCSNCEDNRITLKCVQCFQAKSNSLFCGTCFEAHLLTKSSRHHTSEAYSESADAENIDVNLVRSCFKDAHISSCGSKASVWKYIHSLGSTTLGVDLFCMSNDQLAPSLVGRTDSQQQIARIFSQWKNNHALERKAGRTSYPIPVCSGMKGLGKSRLLEEWRSHFKAADVPRPWLGICVPYYNGHSVVLTDYELPNEASFAWRLLHRFFFVGHKVCGDFLLHLPPDAGTLTLALALAVIRDACIESHFIEPTDTLHMFIGIDEYQAIPNYTSDHQCAQSSERTNPIGGLQRVVDCILDTAISSANNVCIYPLFAGTHWGKMSALTASSNAVAERIWMQYLSPVDSEDMVSSFLPHLLRHTHFRKHLYFLGGLPRPIYEYARAVDSLTPADRSIENMGAAFQHVWEKRYTRLYAQIPSRSLVRLVAFALSGLDVNETDLSGIVVGDTDFRWGAVRDMGLCSLLSTETGTSHRVYVPYSVLRICAAINIWCAPIGDAAKHLVTSIKQFVTVVDNGMYEVEMWQLWEKFGAYFYCFRVNSLLEIGINEISLADLFVGSFNNNCTDTVKLTPMRVFRSAVAICPELPDVLPEFENTARQINWRDGNEVVINVTGGVAVDIFFALKLRTGGLVTVLDQRKRRSQRYIQQKEFNSLYDSAMAVAPARRHDDDNFVFALFNNMSSRCRLELTNKTAIVVSCLEHSTFYGCMSTHPAANPSC